VLVRFGSVRVVGALSPPVLKLGHKFMRFPLCPATLYLELVAAKAQFRFGTRRNSIMAALET